jgi:uncharacterized SAM-binding protein YcdF (DUF218 family)
MPARQEETGSRTVVASKRPRRRLFGLLTRRERWGLSGPGWLLIILGAVITIVVIFPNLYSFFAVTHRVQSDILVVEGWVHPYAVRAAVKEFRTGSYQRVFTTGGPVVGRGGYVNDFQTEASVGAELLKKQGLPPAVLQMVPTRVMGRDRTYASAVALRNRFRADDLQVRSLNIITEGAHARRTRLLFEKALGPDVEVGVISISSPDFDAAHWWYYSEGVEDVVEEALGYLYAKFFFYPREKNS